MRQAAHRLDELLMRHAHQVVKAVPYNEHRHFFITTNKGTRLYVAFKRQPFMSFDEIFQKDTGAAESLNKSWLDKALELGAHYVVFIYENGGIYAITPERFDDKGVERVTEAGEKTVSIPMKELTSLEKILEVLS